MTSTRVLYLGGTGTISSACVRRSLALGHEVWVVNRGHSPRPLPEGVHALVADVRDAGSLASALGTLEFDAVADFLSFVPRHVEAALRQVEDRTGQYVFVSSATVYQKPLVRSPIVESTPLGNPFWDYARDKIACEELLARAAGERGLPRTVVRPSHTYDERRLPNLGRWTDVLRMREGKPVIVFGDGTSRWTITHADDFAVGFCGLLGLPAAIGETVHITGDHAPTWDMIYRWIAEAAGVPEPRLVHVASETIATLRPDLGPPLLGDKAHSSVFDTRKLSALVPEFRTTIGYDEGARRAVAFADADPASTRDPAVDRLSDTLVAMVESVADRKSDSD